MKSTQAGDTGENSKEAFGFAQDTTKQVISLSTGILTISITFYKSISAIPSPGIGWCLALSWVLYLFSILFGVWTLLALTGSLEPAKKAEPQPSITGKNITLPARLQIIAFVFGIVFTVTYGITSLWPIMFR